MPAPSTKNHSITMNHVRRIYVFAPAASGKTTFNSKIKRKGRFQIIDFDMLLPNISCITKILSYIGRAISPFKNLSRKTKSFTGPKEYQNLIFNWLRQQETDTIVFGRRPPLDLSQFDDIEFALVLIPEKDHVKNCHSRKNQMRNPIPFMHHWTTNFVKVKKIRDELREYAKKRNIPIYNPFTNAIDAITYLPDPINRSKMHKQQ